MESRKTGRAEAEPTTMNGSGERNPLWGRLPVIMGWILVYALTITWLAMYEVQINAATLVGVAVFVTLVARWCDEDRKKRAEETKRFFEQMSRFRQVVAQLRKTYPWSHG